MADIRSFEGSDIAQGKCDSDAAKSLYLSASFDMRSGEYRRAREALQKSLAIFYNRKDPGSVKLVQSKIKQLDMVEMQELGSLKTPESRRAIHSENAVDLEDRTFLDKLTHLQDEEDRILIRERSQRILTLAAEPRGRSVAVPSKDEEIVNRGTPTRLLRSSSQSRRSLSVTTGSNKQLEGIVGTINASPPYLATDESHADLLRLHADGEELLEAGLLELEDGRLLDARERFLQAADAFAAADMTELAREAVAHAEAVSHAVRVEAESAAFGAVADWDGAADWDDAAHRAAADALISAAMTFGRLGRSGEEEALRHRGGVAAALVAAVEARVDALALARSGDYASADTALERAEVAMRSVSELEAEYWLSASDDMNT